MFVKNLGGDLRGMKEGFGYLLRGAQQLFKIQDILLMIIVPVVVNAILLGFFIFGAVIGIQRFLAVSLPETWWAVLLIFALIITVIIAIIYIGSVIFAFLGSILSAPFYDFIARKTAESVGESYPLRSWWNEIGSGSHNAVVKLWWYAITQGGLVILYIIPGIVGPFAYTFLGFLATCFFLSLEYLDFSPEFRKLSFTERQAWCLKRKGVILGFGAAIFLFLVIPVVNLFVPAAATAGAILLYHDYAKPNFPRKS